MYSRVNKSNYIYYLFLWLLKKMSSENEIYLPGWHNYTKHFAALKSAQC